MVSLEGLQNLPLPKAEGLNRESREINEVFHDSRKFFEGFHVKSVRDGMIIVP